jgi:hypothetical protein
MCLTKQWTRLVLSGDSHALERTGMTKASSCMPAQTMTSERAAPVVGSDDDQRRRFAGVLLLAVFVAIQARSEHPLLPLPAFTQEAAAARLEAARLREQNTTLQTRLAELEARPRRHDTASIQRWGYSTTE